MSAMAPICADFVTARATSDNSSNSSSAAATAATNANSTNQQQQQNSGASTAPASSSEDRSRSSNHRIMDSAKSHSSVIDHSYSSEVCNTTNKTENKSSSAEDGGKDSNKTPSAPTQSTGSRGSYANRRSQLRAKREARLKIASTMYHNDVSELFSHTSDGLYIDANAIRKKPSAQFLSFLQTNKCPKTILDEVTKIVGIPVITNNDSELSNRLAQQPPPANVTSEETNASGSRIESKSEHKFIAPDIPNNTGSISTSTSSHLNASSNILKHTDSSLHPEVHSATTSNVEKKPVLNSWHYPSKQIISDTFRNALIEKVKQEAWVIKRVQELSREGLWTQKLFPRVCERPRGRTHWDFLLQEMQWLSVDFYQERQWKKSAAKMLAYSAKEFVEKWPEIKAKRKHAEDHRKRKIASFLAKGVRNFWAETAKISEAKQITPDLSSSHGQTNLKSTAKFKEICENGLLDHEDELSSEDESTISEQERYESETTTSEERISELKNLALDLTQPLDALLPSGYCDNHTSECNLEISETQDMCDNVSESDNENDDNNEIQERLHPNLIRTSLSTRQVKLYEDVLADPKSQAAFEIGDLSDAAKVISHLRQVCNNPDLTAESSHFSSLLQFPRIADMEYPLLFCGVLDYDPFKHFDLASLNLVFLAHESELTAITSNRIAKCCAPRKLIEELPKNESSSSSNAPPSLPLGRIALELQYNQNRVVSVSSRTLPKRDKNMTQVAKIEEEKETLKSSSESEKKHSNAFHEDSLRVIASFNERRCKGLPLYGQDLITALTVVDSVRLLPTRFRGMGYVNCLNAITTPSSLSKKKPWKDKVSDFFRKTSALASLVTIGTRAFKLQARKVTLFKPWPPLALVQNRNANIHSVSLQVLPALAKVASKYSLPIQFESRYSERNILVSHQVQSFPKLNALFKRFKDIRLAGERVILFCELDSTLSILREILSREHFPFVFYDGKAEKTRRLVQLARFLKNRSNVCLLTQTTAEPLDQMVWCNISNVIFFDTPVGFASSSTVKWRRFLPDVLSVDCFVCSGTVEENLWRKSVQAELKDQNLCQENGLTNKIQCQTLRQLVSLCQRKVDIMDEEKDPLIGEEILPVEDAEELALKLWSNEFPSVAGSESDMNHGDSWMKDEDDQELVNSLDSFELSQVVGENLKPIQRYGLKNIGGLLDIPALDCSPFEDEDELADDKFHFESNYQLSLRELALQLDFLDSLPCLTYPIEDSLRSWHGRDGKPMPLWTPIPSTAVEGDLVDQYLSFLYQTDLMEESELPPVHVKKEAPSAVVGTKRTASEAGLHQDMSIGAHNSLATTSSNLSGSSSVIGIESSKAKIRKEDVHSSVAPRSLFDRSNQMFSKIRKEKGQQRFRTGGGSGATVVMPQGQNSPLTGLSLNAVAGLRHPLPRPQVDADNSPEWLIQEDWALLRAVRELLEMPLNVNILKHPAHTPNWDVVSDVVNSVSRVYRGPRQCRSRYETIIVPREEGRILYDVSAALAAQQPTKNKKKNQKNIGGGSVVKGLQQRGMKTSQLFTQDNNVSWSKLYANRFEEIKSVANKRTPTTKPLLVNPVQKNTKHAAVLAESGISYEAPLSPKQVAANRAERIQKEKQRPQVDQQQQQLAQQQRVAAAQNAANQAQQVAAAQSAAAAARNSVTVAATHSQLQQQLAQQVVSKAPAQAVVVGISQPSGSTSTQHVIVQGSPAVRLAALQQQQQQQQQQVGTIQEIAGRLTSQASASGGSSTPVSVVGTGSGAGTVVSVANLTASQLQAAQKIVNQSGSLQRNIITASGRPLTPAQIQMLRQRSAEQQQQSGNTLQVRQAISGSNSGVTGTVVGTSTSTGQKVSIAVTPSGAIAALSNASNAQPSGINAVTVVTQALQGQKAHLIRQLGSTAKGTIRQATENDMRLILASKQAQISGQGGKTQLTSIQVPSGQQGNIGQFLSQAGIQIQTAASSGGTPVATLVKTASSASSGAGTTQVIHGQGVVSSGGSGQPQSVTIPMANVKAIRGANPQQMQQILQRQYIQQRAKGGTAGATLAQGVSGQQKVAFSQVSGAKGVVPTAQLIVSSGSGQKQIQPVTVQQIQQLVKSAQQQGGNIQHISTASPNILQHGVLNKQGSGSGAKAVSSGLGQQLQARVIPVSTSGGRTSQIHVVAASNNASVGTGIAANRQQAAPRTVVATSGMPSVNIDSNNLAISTAKSSSSASSAAVFNQVSYGQPISVSVRTPQSQQQQQQKVQMVQQIGGNIKQDGSGNQQQK